MLDRATIHDHDAVCQRHGFDLIVSDIDRGRLHHLVHALDLGAHLHTQFGVEIRQRLVEQEHFRITYDRAPHRDALTLPAG